MNLQPISSLHTTPVLQRQPGAPPFDVTRPIQRFVLPAGTTSYRAFSNGRITDVHIPSVHAETPNLPGLPEYPAWQIAPTPAVQGSWLGEQPINPAALATREQAEQLARELSTDRVVTVREADASPFFPIHYRGDQRRMFQLYCGGQGVNAGHLLSLQYALGVGHPGYWVWSESGPIWTPARLGDGAGAPELPHPCRDLLPGERFAQQFGGVWMVEIVNRDAPTLENIYAALRRIEARLKS